jgi:hypothetical protein
MNYKIRKGRHFANFTFDRLWPFIKGKSIDGTFMFDSSCWYSRDSVKNHGWNKLLGVTSIRIHKKSGRLVWQPDFDCPGQIIIATYVYDKGVRKIKEIARVKVKQEVIWIMVFMNLWTFIVGLETGKVKGSIPWLKFKAFPFFGGKDKAGKTMVIKVNWK